MTTRRDPRRTAPTPRPSRRGSTRRHPAALRARRAAPAGAGAAAVLALVVAAGGAAGGRGAEQAPSSLPVALAGSEGATGDGTTGDGATGDGAAAAGTATVSALPTAGPADGGAREAVAGDAAAAAPGTGAPGSGPVADGPVAGVDGRPLASASDRLGPGEGSTDRATPARAQQVSGVADVPVVAGLPAPAPAQAASGVPTPQPQASAVGVAAETTASAPRVALSGPAEGAALPAGCTVHLVGTATSAAEATVVWQVRTGTRTVLQGSSVVAGADGTAAALGAQGSWEAFVDLPAGSYTVRVEIPDDSDGEGGGMPAVERSFTVGA
ncbi:Gmad2 immunoglobulin-like domain-containing protein [Pseudokineococcus sp. 5B2Z-1]|uniref:Gmad2 immunoglobulin-like domain-containing protein n=1 Tax=Pseudokineococcus sp. 5B2Z-1 TaxID=3132744 RepID=UPI0030A3ACCC